MRIRAAISCFHRLAIDCCQIDFLLRHGGAGYSGNISDFVSLDFLQRYARNSDLPLAELVSIDNLADVLLFRRFCRHLRRIHWR